MYLENIIFLYSLTIENYNPPHIYIYLSVLMLHTCTNEGYTNTANWSDKQARQPHRSNYPKPFHKGW